VLAKIGRRRKLLANADKSVEQMSSTESSGGIPVDQFFMRAYGRAFASETSFGAPQFLAPLRRERRQIGSLSSVRRWSALETNPGTASDIPGIVRGGAPTQPAAPEWLVFVNLALQAED
jgi:hypothetical protein